MSEKSSQLVRENADAALNGEASADPLLGHVVGGKYRVIEKLGAGGMGAVYKAEHTLLGRNVALKILHYNLSQSEEYLERFRREALVASKLSHPNAITLFDFGLEERSPYLVMQFVEGRTLKQALLDEGALSLSRICDILLQIGGALDEAHSLGIIHRDLKPDNIMLSLKPDGTERASILDFGIAKPTLGHEGGVHLTQAGVFMGTPQYMSPEQALDKACDARADIYALGIILYEMITGEVPFKSASPVEMLFKHIHDTPIPARTFKPGMNIPQRVSDVIAKALEKDPEKRYQKVNELVFALQDAVDNRTPTVSAPVRRAETDPSKKAPLFVMAGLASLVAAGAAFALLSGGSNSPDAVSTIDASELQDSAVTSERLPITEQHDAPVAAASVAAAPLASAAPAAQAQPEPEAEQIVVATAPQDAPAVVSEEITPDTNPSSVSAVESIPPTSEVTTSVAPLAGEPAQVQTVSSEPVREEATATLDTQPADPVDATITVSDELQRTTLSDAPSDPLPTDAFFALSMKGIEIEAGTAPRKESRAEGDRLASEAEKLRDEKQYLEAAGKYREALLFRPGHLGARLSLGLCLLRLGKPELAKEHFDKALSLQADYPPTFYNLATYYAYTNDATQSVELLKKAIKLFPKMKSWAQSDPDFDTIRSDAGFQALLAE